MIVYATSRNSLSRCEPPRAANRVSTLRANLMERGKYQILLIRDRAVRNVGQALRLRQALPDESRASMSNVVRQSLTYERASTFPRPLSKNPQIGIGDSARLG